jgi:hypothetical protein
VLSDASGHDSSVFVTDAAGHATAHLRVRPRSLRPELTGGAPDSVLVVARAQYRGVPLSVTPSDTFKIEIRRSLK